MIRRSWTRAASIEETLALWAASLREIKRRIRPLFRQERVATNAGLFLEGLLGDEQRKTGWMRAEAAGDPGPWRLQAILGRSDWDADALRDIAMPPKADNPRLDPSFLGYRPGCCARPLPTKLSVHASNRAAMSPVNGNILQAPCDLSS